MSAQQLQEAYRLIKEGRKMQAAALLVPIVRAEQDNADAWWLLANAVEKPDQAQRALEQVLRLRPDDERARRMLDKITGQAHSAVPVEPVVDSPPASDALAYAAPEKPKRSEPDPFASFASTDEIPDPFNEAGAPYDPFADDEKPKRVPVQQSSRSGCASPIVLLLGCLVIAPALICIAGLAIGGTALIASLPVIGVFYEETFGTLVPAMQTGMPEFREAFETMVPGLQTAMPDIQEAMQTGVPELEAALRTASPQLGGVAGTLTFSLTPESSAAGQRLGPGTARGVIEPGQTVSQTLSPSTDDHWTFSGSAGDRMVIELNATDDSFDPQLYLHNPDGINIAENDDIDLANSNRNSRIEVVLPENGSYTIVVASFGTTGGPYELSLSRK